MYINFVMYIKNKNYFQYFVKLYNMEDLFISKVEKQCNIALQAKIFPELAAGEILLVPSFM